jgi:hypothetical protein
LSRISFSMWSCTTSILICCSLTIGVTYAVGLVWRIDNNCRSICAKTTNSVHSISRIRESSWSSAGVNWSWIGVEWVSICTVAIGLCTSVHSNVLSTCLSSTRCCIPLSSSSLGSWLRGTCHIGHSITCIGGGISATNCSGSPVNLCESHRNHFEVLHIFIA